MTPERRAELKRIFNGRHEKIPKRYQDYYQKNLNSLLNAYRCALYRDKFNLPSKVIADRVGLSLGRMHELLRKMGK